MINPRTALNRRRKKKIEINSHASDTTALQSDIFLRTAVLLPLVDIQSCDAVRDIKVRTSVSFRQLTGVSGSVSAFGIRQ